MDVLHPKDTVTLESGEVLSQRGATPLMAVVRNGWGAKFVRLDDGRRQIIDVLLPGEIATCEEITSAGSAAPVVGLSRLDVCVFDREAFIAAVHTPDALLALWKACAGQAFRLRELVATLGKQSAEVRIAAFIVGMHRRLTALDRVTGEVMPFPLRQKDIADILGLTQVHVSRMLKLLRDKKLIEIDDDGIRLLDIAMLARVGQR